MPAALERDTLEVPVNGKRDLFVQTTRKRKTGSIRFDHSEIFTNASTRKRAKTLMNLTARQDEAGSLAGKVCAISSCGRIAAVKIQSAKYVRFRDIQLHEFEREGLTGSDEKLDIDMYRCPFAGYGTPATATCSTTTISCACFNLKCFLPLNCKTLRVSTCESLLVTVTCCC
jgi:hypothetical protein